MKNKNKKNSNYFFKSRTELEKHQFRNLNKLVSLTYENNSFYRDYYKSVGKIFPKKIKSWKQFYDLPMISKRELQKDQDNNPPFGKNININIKEKGVRIRHTSGTTGKSLLIVEDEDDVSVKQLSKQRLIEKIGIDNKDIVYMVFNHDLYEVFFQALINKKCKVYTTGDYSLEKVLEILFNNGITVLFCIPSYFIFLSQVALNNNFDLSKSSLKTIVVTGETGGFDQQFRDVAEKQWKARVIVEGGSTETDEVFLECLSNKGKCHLSEEYLICEVIDPKTLKHCNEGELVVTSIWKKGSSLIRYRTGDWVKLVNRKCKCGNTTKLIDGRSLIRIDEAVKINGYLVYPSMVERMIISSPHISNCKIELFRFKGNFNKVKIFIESSRIENKFHANLLRQIEDYMHIFPEVTFVNPGELCFSKTWKTKRIKIHKEYSVEKKEISHKHFYKKILNKIKNKLTLLN